MEYNQTFTLTFGDQAENHVGMAKIGTPSTKGFDLTTLLTVQAKFLEMNSNIQAEIFDLGSHCPNDHGCGIQGGYLLIVRQGLQELVDADEFFEEQQALPKDTQAYMYGQVRNKHARHNLCFGHRAQKADIQNGRGTIVAFEDVPLLKEVKTKLEQIFPNRQAEGLVAEGNYYHDPAKCGIGFHGDAERKKVVGIRVGREMPFHYQWFFKSKPIGERMIFNLGHGDLYVMSTKAVGSDWKKKNVPTLRHAAGAPKFLRLE